MTPIRFTSTRSRFALGVAGMLVTAAVVRRDRVGRREQQVFRMVNEIGRAHV